jgi:uncharacterized protein
MTQALLIAKAGETELNLLPRMANRHGLIAGATGTGKTVTLQTFSEHFSRIGVPVFLADVKGDLSGMGFPGGGNAKVEARVQQLGLQNFSYAALPVHSGMYSASRGTRYAQLSPSLGHCCSRVC